MFSTSPSFFLSILIALSLLVASNASQAHAQACEPSELLIVVDRSSSMRHLLPDGVSKWQAARQAVRAIGEEFAAAELGIMVFPSPDRCGPGELVLEPDLHTPDALIDALGTPPPRVGNHTPIAQTLASLLHHPDLSDQAHIVLITDGWQWCDPYDRSMRGASIRIAGELRAQGKTVHVVGFGGSVDALTLGQTAVAGGAPLAPCDVTRTEPTGTGHCYRQADDAESLSRALQRVVALAVEEHCNGRDDDCDGVVDEGFDRDGDGHSACDPEPDCDDTNAAVYPGATERCDGIDHDCDGALPTHCACEPGQSRSCAIIVDHCQGGAQLCLTGRWGVCEGIPVRQPETCDGLDNDCDGVIDETAACTDGMQCRQGVCAIELAENAISERASGVWQDAGSDGGQTPPFAPPSCFCHSVGGPQSLPAPAFFIVLATWIDWRRRHRCEHS